MELNDRERAVLADALAAYRERCPPEDFESSDEVWLGRSGPGSTREEVDALVKRMAEPPPVRHDNLWEEDPSFPRSEWADEAGNDDTLLGYWDWVEAQKEQESDDEKDRGEEA
jgi:hypothetical protein